MTTSIDLLPYLESVGLRIKGLTGADEIQAWCPAHADRTGHADVHPSFYFNQTKQVGICFSCDWRVADLGMLVTELTGAPPADNIMDEVREQNVIRKVAEIVPETRREVFSEERRHLEWRLATKFTDVPLRLLDLRRIGRSAAQHYGLRWDPEHHCQVLPIRTPQGELLGWQQRQKGAVYNYPEGIKKSETLFGMHLVREAEQVALVESPLDVVRLHQAGIPAVASFGAILSKKQTRLLARNYTTVVIALDNDQAGQDQASRIAPLLRPRVGVLRWDYSGTTAKDPGDYPTDASLQSAWRRTMRLGF